HPHGVSPARRTARLRGAARARGDALADVRDLLRLRALRASSATRGERGVPRLREVRGEAPPARRTPASARAAPERGPAREPRAPAAREPDLSRDGERAPDRVREDRARERRARLREPRPVRRPRWARDRAGVARAAASLRRPR